MRSNNFEFFKPEGNFSNYITELNKTVEDMRQTILERKEQVFRWDINSPDPSELGPSFGLKVALDAITSSIVISANEACIATLKKMENGEPITAEEHANLMQVEKFAIDKRISDYKNIQHPESPTPSLS